MWRRQLIWIILAIFFAGYFFLIYRLHFNYSTTDSDLAIYDQQIWFLSQGRLTPSSFKDGFNAFGDHFGLVEIFIAPFYWLWDSVVVLLILQELAIVLSAFPIYLTFKKVLKTREVWALVFVVIYLLFFGFQAATIFPFHLATLGAVFIAWVIWAMLEKRWLLYWVTLVLMLITKEDMPLLGMVMGLYLIITQRNFKHGFGTLVVSFSYFYFVTDKIIPFFAGRKYGYFVSQLGETPTAIVIKALKNPIEAVVYFFTPLLKARTMVAMFASFGFLPLLSPTFLFLVSPFLAERFLNDTLQRHLPWMHYSASQGPLLAYGAIFGLKNLVDISARYWPKIKREWLIALALLASLILTVGVTLVYKMPLLNLLRPGFYQGSESSESIDKALKLVPREASIATQASLQPHLSHRDVILIYPDPARRTDGGDDDLPPEAKPEDYAFADVDYLLLSLNAFHWRPVTQAEFSRQIDYVKSRPEWEIIFDQDGTTLFKRKGR